MPNKRDEGTKEHSRIVITDGRTSGVELVKPVTTSNHWNASLQVFLHLQSSPSTEAKKKRPSDENKAFLQEKTRVGTLTLIINPISESKNDLADFFGKIDRLMINVDGLGAMGKVQEEISDEIKRVCTYYLNSGAISLLGFLIGLSWSFVVRKIMPVSKMYTANTEPLIQLGKEFVREQHELRNTLSFQYKELVVDEMPKVSDCNLANYDWLRFITLLAGYSSGLEEDQASYVDRKAVQLTPFSYFVFNRGLYIMGANQHPESLFLNGRLDYSEWGERWGSAWSILMSVMLCYFTQIFILYNNEEETHVSEGREALELEILRNQPSKILRLFTILT